MTRIVNRQEHSLKSSNQVRFRTAHESLVQERQGVRRWWWEFLRLSQDYWLVCRTTKGRRVHTQDERLARTYRAFGDIYNCTFDEWWLDRGYKVFSERDSFPRVAELSSQLITAQSTKPHDHIWVDIPLKLSRRTIQRQIGKLLDQHEDLRLSNRLELSSAEFKVEARPTRIKNLQKIYEVCLLHRELIDKPRARFELVGDDGFSKRADLFRIGKLLHVSRSNEQGSSEKAENARRKNRMRASVSRLLRHGQNMIRNAEVGLFPINEPCKLTAIDRFSGSQIFKHQKFLDEWWKLDLTSKLSTGKLDAARRIHYEEELKARHSLVEK
jgi:hypothetical protein